MAIVIKTVEQIEGIRQSCILAAETLRYLGTLVQPGITTKFLDQKAFEYMRDHKARPATLNYKGYPASICTSVNDVICHGVPGPYELRDGDIINIDVTTVLNGYYGDTCKMFEVGEVAPYAKQLMQVTLESMDIGIAQCYAGNRLGNMGYEIGKYAKAHGYSVVYEFCGHGVGLKFHEEPEVSHISDPNTGPVLRPGMIFTVEPMINAGKARSKVDRKDGWTARTIDGKLSAQYEETVLVTADGPIALTDIENRLGFDVYQPISRERVFGQVTV